MGNFSLKCLYGSYTQISVEVMRTLSRSCKSESPGALKYYAGYRLGETLEKLRGVTALYRNKACYVHKHTCTHIPTNALAQTAPLSTRPPPK